MHFFLELKSQFYKTVFPLFIIRKVKVSRNRPEQAQGVPGRLRPRIFLTLTRVEGRQPYAPAAFTPGEIPGTHF